MIWSVEKYTKALQFAALAHHGQTYKGREQGVEYDYIAHTVAVAAQVIHGLPATPDCNADLAIQCALLHDVIEDTAVTYPVLLETFGSEVAVGVQALTKNPFLDKKDQMLDSLERIQEQPAEIAMVKLADRFNNLDYVPWHWGVSKVEAYRHEAKLILRQLGYANEWLAKDLEKRIANYSL